MTMIAMTAHSATSTPRSVRIEVEPNSVEHTSPEIFDEVGNRFISI